MSFINMVSGVWQDGGRGQFLVMGMPAVVAMVIGVTACLIAATNTNQLSVRYEGLAQTANSEARRIAEDIATNGATSSAAATPGSEAAEDPRRTNLQLELSKERIYLEKLISLDASNPEHKYKLAMLSLRKGNLQEGLTLLLNIAPFDSPGYAKAHLHLAKHFIGLQQRASSQDVVVRNRDLASQQIDNCLIADESSLEAQQIRAFLYKQDEKYLRAYDIYQELFEDDPLYYTELLNLAGILGKDRDRVSILDSAKRRFRAKTDQETENVKEWVDLWNHYINCLTLDKDFETADRALRASIQKFTGDPGKKDVFLTRLLSRVYTTSVVNIGRDTTTEQKQQQVRALQKAYEADPKNEAALQWLTILGGDSDVSKEALAIFDPSDAADVPWVVLSELGNLALGKEEFEDAISYYELARKKNPKNPQILNNLAYSYLQVEDRNPEDALLLVDQAIIYLNNSPNFRNMANRAVVAASFYDTRGAALMRLNRMNEAIAALETAYQSRPKSKEILQRLVDCHTGRNERQAEVYRLRLAAVEKEELEEAGN